MHRRKLVQMAAAALSTAALQSRRVCAAPPIVLTYAVNLSPDHPVSVRAGEAVAAIKQAAGGQIDIKLLPADQLTSRSDLLTRLQRGAIQLLGLSGLTLSRLVPATAICGTGFAWRSYEQLWAAMDGSLGERLRAEITQSGIVPMARVWDSGFRQITTSTRPIAEAGDLTGLKIRVPAHPVWIQMFRALDSNPIVIAFTELHSALQSKTVEAQENPLITINAARLYEVQSHLSLTNHVWDGWWWLVNGSVWNGLPNDLREIIATNLDAAAMKQRQDMVSLDQRLQKEFSDRGMTVNPTQHESFRSRLSTSRFYEDLRAAFPADTWAVFAQSSGL
jgi:tripartite ATP-independent transporter DctP family solute receptor